jgi:hypothetical protein
LPDEVGEAQVRQDEVEGEAAKRKKYFKPLKEHSQR